AAGYVVERDPPRRAKTNGRRWAKTAVRAGGTPGVGGSACADDAFIGAGGPQIRRLRFRPAMTWLQPALLVLWNAKPPTPLRTATVDRGRVDGGWSGMSGGGRRGLRCDGGWPSSPLRSWR